MQQSLKLPLVMGAFILFILILISLLYQPIFAQEGGEGGSGEDRGGTGDHCVGDRGRDREGNECRPDPNPPCTDYLGSLPPELAFFEPTARASCLAGQPQTGYTYRICRDTCDNSLWLQSHGPVCAADEVVPPPQEPPVLPPPPPAQAIPSASPTYICQEVSPPPGSTGKQLQLRYLRCGLR